MIGSQTPQRLICTLDPKMSIYTALKLTAVVAMVCVVTQCSALQSQKNRNYRLTTIPFEKEATLTYDAAADDDISSLVMLQNDGKPDQLWQILPDDDGFYRITNRAVEGKSLEVFDGVIDARTRLADSARDVGQMWQIDHIDGDHYRLTNKWLGPDRSLTIVKEDEYKFVLAQSGNKDSQLWKKIDVGNGFFRIANKARGNNEVLAQFEDGAVDFEAAMGANHTHQYWKMVAVGSEFRLFTGYDEFYKVDRSLEISTNPKNQKYSDLKMVATGNSDTQRWKVEQVDNEYFRLVSPNGKALDSEQIVSFSLMMEPTSESNTEQFWKLLRVR